MLRSMALVLTKKPVRDPGPAMRRYHLELQLLMLVCLRLDFMEPRLALKPGHGAENNLNLSSCSQLSSAGIVDVHYFASFVPL